MTLEREDGAKEPLGVLIGVLMVAAAIAALARGLTASPLGRLAVGAAAVVLVGVGAGCVRGRTWAAGTAFFLGLFWAWAVVALGVQGRLGWPSVMGWSAWAIAVTVASVRMRRDA